jgi:hypothetical protein
MRLNWAEIECTNNNEVDVQNKICNPQGSKMLLYLRRVILAGASR